ncbi:MAG: hypothetical protein Q8Q59_01040 [Luteolibacter sp.]|jgi:hypothetical protein|nr:hypothetical protein [Luteolibacter sp.]
MNRKPQPTEDSWEHDAVWKLLDQSPPASASPRFADETLRAARLAGQTAPWWKRIFTPAPLAGLAAATAALVFAVLSLQTPAPDSTGQTTLVLSSDFAEIQEIAETEVLISAVDQLDDYSDMELVCLIGF